MVQTTQDTDADILEPNTISLTCFSHNHKQEGDLKQKNQMNIMKAKTIVGKKTLTDKLR